MGLRQERRPEAWPALPELPRALRAQTDSHPLPVPQGARPPEVQALPESSPEPKAQTGSEPKRAQRRRSSTNRTNRQWRREPAWFISWRQIGARNRPTLV